MSHSIADSQNLRIIDALGPFIVGTDRPAVNWSKVIFADLETKERISPATQNRIVKRFDRFTSQIASLGYNALSIDDLAHLVPLDCYRPSLQTLLENYRHLYRRLFSIAKKKHLQLFINTDYLFFNDDIDQYLQRESLAPDDFFIKVLTAAFKEFPEIEGVILRIGENDGKDVEGSFLSRLQLRTSAQARSLLKKILPIFEDHGKTLIFRTWTVGVYQIGDLIWNEKTFHAVFGSIESDALIVSMKYGDTDFMRYLSLNSLFFRGSHKKILELQTRREWEGMGMYPSFVGWDYAGYLDQLADNESFVGVHVWCQTGGWAKKAWSNVTYLDNSSFWNELNAEVTINLTQGQSVEAAVAAFCQSRGIKNGEKFLELLRLSDVALKKGLYFPEIAEKSLYFRRSRIPPLMWLTWDRILLSPIVVHLHRILLSKPQAALRDSAEAVAAARKMITLAKEMQFESQIIASLEFEHATLKLFAQLRRYMLVGLSRGELDQLNKHARRYQKKYPQHYEIPHLLEMTSRSRLPRASSRLFLRESTAYRKRDRIILKTSHIQARIIRYYLRRSKSHLADQSMGFESLFK